MRMPTSVAEKVRGELSKHTADGEQFVRNLMQMSTDKQGFVAETAIQDGKIREYILYFLSGKRFYKTAEKIYKKNDCY